MKSTTHLLLFIFSVLTFGCASTSREGTNRFAQTICAPIENASDIFSSRLVIFGEIHGSTETPKFMEALACHLTKLSRSVIVAIELPSDLQPAINRANGSIQIDKSIAAADSFWAAGPADGRSSAAMWNLVSSLHAMKAVGNSLDFVFFDKSYTVEMKQKEREEFLAKTIRNIEKSAPAGTRIVVLTGNLHSRKSRGTPWNRDFEPMAYLLRDLQPLTLDLSHDGGSTWSCNATKCGETMWRGNASGTARESSKFSIHLTNVEGHHDGYFHVGKLSASPPLFPR
jgi:hypothetical protein